MTQHFNSFDSEISQEEQATPSSLYNPKSLGGIKEAVEALLFATSSPLSIKKLCLILEEYHPATPSKIRQAIQSLQEEYLQTKRSFQIDEIAEGYVLRTKPLFYPLVSKLFNSQQKIDKLSSAASEVLAIIAYKQPCTRALIDNLRGVDSSGALTHLIERNLVEAQGKLESPGRPTIYGTTLKFMEYYGLRNLEELPPIILNSPIGTPNDNNKTILETKE